MGYSIWSESKTKNGLTTDEVTSSFQKAVRRGMTELACQYAYELYTTCPELLEKLWTRLISISVEDIGFGNLDAAVQINALNQMRKSFSYASVDQPMFFIHAIRILCESEKDRSSDYLKNIIIKEANMGKVPEILDVGLDKHTKRGAEMGRGSIHFFEEGAKVIPQLPVDNGYKERYREILDNYDPEKAKPDAFKYTAF